jgi:tetratricopeptide (TPR) repeat protein
MLSRYLTPIGYALLVPLAVALALYLFVPAMRTMPTQGWAVIYGFSALGALGGWIGWSRLWNWRYRRAFRRRDHRTLDGIAARLRRTRLRRPLYLAYADIVEGDARLSENRLADAVRLYDSAISRIEETRIATLQASVPLLKNNVAWCLVELESSPDQALALATEAASWAKQQPNAQLRASCLGTLGAAQLRNDQPEAAIANLRESFGLHTDPVSRSSVLYYLGEALRTAGRIKDASDAYRQARDQNPEGRHGRLAAERLAAM